VKAILLAAGRGVRAGGPKAWAMHDGRPLLECQLRFLLTRFSPERISVSIQKEWEPRCRALSAGARWIAVDPDAPALASAIALLDGTPDWTFLHHVDMPVWEPALFDRLASRAAEDAGVEAVIPTFENRGGHPVLLSPAAVAAMAELDPAKHRLDHWLRARRVARVETDWPCVVENWNEGIAR